MNKSTSLRTYGRTYLFSGLRTKHSFALNIVTQSLRVEMGLMALPKKGEENVPGSAVIRKSLPNINIDNHDYTPSQNIEDNVFSEAVVHVIGRDGFCWRWDETWRTANAIHPLMVFDSNHFVHTSQNRRKALIFISSSLACYPVVQKVTMFSHRSRRQLVLAGSVAQGMQGFNARQGSFSEHNNQPRTMFCTR